MPSWVVVTGAPLFRYCPWRDAWVLRVVGESYGPVLRTRQSRRAGRPARDWSPGFSAPRGVLATLLIALIVVGAALGFIVARGDSGSTTPPAGPLDQQASAGRLRVSFPSDWTRRPVPAWFPQPLADAIAVGPAAPAGGVLIIGRTTSTNPQLLPSGLIASSASVPATETVSLGGADFYRYLDVPVRGGHGPAAVYALPTTAGVVLGVCAASGASSALPDMCERSLSTLRLSGGRALALGPSTPYASAFNRAMRRLDAVRAQLGSGLARAGTAGAQAKAAGTLAAAHRQAATALVDLDAGPAATANSAVVSALRRTGAAYSELGAAALTQNAARYDAARRSLRSASEALTAALGQLKPYGYSIST